jgi:hypothetical protein
MDTKFRRPPPFVKTPLPDMEQATASSSSIVVRWLPFICAGAAAGISIVALQELKAMRKELVAVKGQAPSQPSDFNKRMDTMERQLKMLADFVENKQKITKESDVIRNVVSESDNVRIINDEEYEEVEVTDDEEEAEQQ